MSPSPGAGAAAAGPNAVPTHRDVLAIAVPVMLSNVTTPLLGLVDTGVVGQLPEPAYIGAVALGALVFTFVFWAFGFLRMGTTGLTAQAVGARDDAEVVAQLGRALLLAAAAGIALIALQWPIRTAAFALLPGTERVEALALAYFDLRIFAAPATLANYALLGWFIGLGRASTALVLQLVLNVTNIVLDAYFVLGLGWDVRGVALGTAIAEYVAAAVGLWLAWRHVRRLGCRTPFRRLGDARPLRRMLAVNADIMIRSLALLTVFAGFTAAGARAGDVTLAANAVLMQFVAFCSWFLDGLAFAAESLVGRAVGARQRAAFVAAVRLTTQWAAAIAVLLALGIALAGAAVIDLLSVDPAVRSAARQFLPWAVAAPLLGVWAFQLDGVFIGATRTAEMRNAMLASLAICAAAWWLLRGFGNHGLWAAFAVHYVARAGTLLRYAPRLYGGVSA